MTPLLVEGERLGGDDADDCAVRTCGEGHDDRLGRELPYTA